MKKYFVDVTDAAQSDLKEIVSYISIELKNPTSAKRLLAKFKDNILSLEEMPKRQNLVKDEVLSSRGIRRLLIDNYMIFYVVDDSKNKVTVIRILYARRDWESLI
ncbi:MAG: type II toxin-antitoxin system RelE/ParE family toxin [Deltaproteobacteria bacterium]|nr:type II toxin-antitoxin system RelE/ParE family toxin [Deltaproteobacteria bacterium]